MEVLNHLFAALGRLLLSLSSVLMVEELTLGGLARLLLSRPYDSGHGRRKREPLQRTAPRKTLVADSKEVQGGVSCSQSSTY
jgi:hypothetical protein